MKTTIQHISILCFFTAIITSCSTSTSEKEISTEKGRVIETSPNYLSITTSNGDTLTYSTYDINKNNIDKVFLEDSVIINYTMVNGIATVSDIIVINHNLPFINNISAMLVGTWHVGDSADINMPNKIIFRTDSTLEIINPEYSEDRKWYMDGKTIATQCTTAIKNISVIHVDSNKLTLSFSDNNIVHFNKADE